jgi:hypothetical protein
MLRAIMLSVIMLSVIMLSVILLSFNTLSIIMLSVIMLSVLMERRYAERRCGNRRSVVERFFRRFSPPLTLIECLAPRERFFHRKKDETSANFRKYNLALLQNFIIHFYNSHFSS